MADGLLLTNPEAVVSGVTQGVQGFGHAVYTFLFILLGVIIIGGLLWLALWTRSFKFKVKIKEVISSDGHFIILEDKAKRKKKDGAEFWKLKRRKALITAPPSNALQVTGKGSFYAECMHEEKAGLDAGYQWIIPDKNPSSGAYKISSSQEERSLLADRVRRAEERKGKSLLDIVMQFAGMTFVLIIVIVLLAFYSEIAGSVSESAREVGLVAQHQQKILSEQIEFQEQLNELFSELSCEPPIVNNKPVDLPLDKVVS